MVPKIVWNQSKIQILSTMCGLFQQTSLPKDQNLVAKGQTCQKLCFINKGFLRFYNDGPEKSITHWIFGPGQMITDVSSFYLDDPAKWNIQALSDCSLMVIDRTDYQRMRTIIPEWDQVEKLLLIKLMSALENRVYAFLSMSAEERFDHLFDADPDMFNQLPLQYLSSMLGMTPETLSRIRRKRIS